MRLPLPLKHYFKQHHFEERFWIKFSLCTKCSFTYIVLVILLMKAIIWILCLNEYLTWHLKFIFMTDLITIHNCFVVRILRTYLCLRSSIFVCSEILFFDPLSLEIGVFRTPRNTIVSPGKQGVGSQQTLYGFYN